MLTLRATSAADVSATMLAICPEQVATVYEEAGRRIDAELVRQHLAVNGREPVDGCCSDGDDR